MNLTPPKSTKPSPAAATAKPAELPVQRRSNRHPTLNPAGIQVNPYFTD
jgi:hypothetical protein